jgi:hypothetical protein
LSFARVSDACKPRKAYKEPRPLCIIKIRQKICERSGIRHQIPAQQGGVPSAEAGQSTANGTRSVPDTLRMHRYLGIVQVILHRDARPFQ